MRCWYRDPEVQKISWGAGRSAPRSISRPKTLRTSAHSAAHIGGASPSPITDSISEVWKGLSLPLSTKKCFLKTAGRSMTRSRNTGGRIKNLHAKIIEQDAMIKVLHQRSRKDPGKNDSSSLRPARSVPSIAAVTLSNTSTGVHSRQTSVNSNQAAEEKKEEKARKGSIGLNQGKDHHEIPSPSLLLLPPSLFLPPPIPLVTASHAKTGSKDNSTQTEKSPELFWPNSASFPGRGRINMTPSSSPLLRHTANKACEKLDNSPVLGKTPDHRGRVGNTAHKNDFPEAENTMEVLI
eukprot:XP_017947241.1 PREDICTED: angiomotin-like protein 1 isoform X1 [Xenopus tropicalis]